MIHVCPVWEENCSLPLFPRTSFHTVVLLLGLQQTVPAANLLSFRLFHLSPVGELLLSRAIEAERNPANHLLALHAALVVNREDERDVRQLEKCYLEDKRLFVGWVGLAAANGRLALGHLMTHGVQQGQLHICICARNRWGGWSESKGWQPSEVLLNVRFTMPQHAGCFKGNQAPDQTSFVQNPYVSPNIIIHLKCVVHCPPQCTICFSNVTAIDIKDHDHIGYCFLLITKHCSFW